MADNRTQQKKEAQRRLEFLVGCGLDEEIAKKFKSLGRVYVNELTSSEWAEKRGSHNRFPRTYILLDMVEGVTDEMLDKRLQLDNDGYLVYLITRDKVNSADKDKSRDIMNYFIIDRPSNRYVHEAQDTKFREGYAKVLSQNLLTGEEEIKYVSYKVRMGQVIVNREEE